MSPSCSFISKHVLRKTGTFLPSFSVQHTLQPHGRTQYLVHRRLCLGTGRMHYLLVSSEDANKSTNFDDQ